MQIDKSKLSTLLNSRKAYDAQKLSERQAGAKKASNAAAAKKQDVIEISKTAKALFERHAQSITSIQPDKIVVAGTTFSREGMKQALRNAELIRDDEHAETIARKIVEKAQIENTERATKLEQVKSRLSDDFYKSPAVLEKIAEALMQDMNLG